MSQNKTVWKSNTEGAAPENPFPGSPASSKKRMLGWLIPALAVYVVLFACAALWDLPLDQAIHSPKNTFAIMMEAFAWLPAYLPVPLIGGLVLTRSQSFIWQRILGVIFYFAGFIALFYVAYHYLEKRALVTGFSDPRSYAWFVAFIIILVLLFLWILKMNDGLKNKLMHFAVIGITYLVANLVVINIVKLIWQRTRFDDLLASGSFSEFTAWFQPFGFGGSSFPSAHTANAAGIFLLIVLCDIFPAFGRHRKLCYLICWVFIAVMAFSRILIGRHFLSDTLAASGIMALLFWWMRSTKIYQSFVESARNGRVLLGRRK